VAKEYVRLAEKPFEANWKWPMGNQMVICPMTSRDLQVKVMTPIRLGPNISKTAGDSI